MSYIILHYYSVIIYIYSLFALDRSNYRKAVNEMKEMKLLLDMYKGVGKEQRDKVQLMAAERKTRAELDELRQQIKKIQVFVLDFKLKIFLSFF